MLIGRAGLTTHPILEGFVGVRAARAEWTLGGRTAFMKLTACTRAIALGLEPGFSRRLRSRVHDSKPLGIAEHTPTE